MLQATLRESELHICFDSESGVGRNRFTGPFCPIVCPVILIQWLPWALISRGGQHAWSEDAQWPMD